MDLATRWIELVRIPSKDSHEWLSCYPRPTRCVHDQGSEFIGEEFQDTESIFLSPFTAVIPGSV